MKKLLVPFALLVAILSVMALASCGHIHTLSEPVIENEVDPTCRKDGSYDEVIYCTECENELARTKKKIDRLPHEFVDGICSVCGFKQSESSKGLAFILNPDGSSYSLQRIGSCTDENIVIGTYNDLPVTKILYGALEGCRNIKSILIYDSVQEIEAYAFRDCSSLESINIPAGVAIIN